MRLGTGIKYIASRAVHVELVVPESRPVRQACLNAVASGPRIEWVVRYDTTNKRRCVNETEDPIGRASSDSQAAQVNLPLNTYT